MGNETTNESNLSRTKLLAVITGVFVGVLMLSNILAIKMVQLGPFIFDGGTLLFPLSYIFGDILTEVYGYKATRKVIWTGFTMLALMAVNITVIGMLPSEPGWDHQSAYDIILTPIPRIIIASMIAYFIGEYVNAVVLSKMKVITKGKWLWMRTIGSTVAGQFLDSFTFVAIAFIGLYDIKILIVMAFSNYLFKTGIEVVFTPVTYKGVAYIKKVENIDVYDHGETYNPLPMQ